MKLWGLFIEEGGEMLINNQKQKQIGFIGGGYI
jgi:hypothetical protein